MPSFWLEDLAFLEEASESLTAFSPHQKPDYQ